MNILVNVRIKQLENSILSRSIIVDNKEGYIIWKGFCLENSYHLIESGTYNLERRVSEDRCLHYILSEVRFRHYILIHPGNKVADTIGCILPGETFGIKDEKYYIFRSNKTMQTLLNLNIKQIVISQSI